MAEVKPSRSWKSKPEQQPETQPETQLETQPETQHEQTQQPEQARGAVTVVPVHGTMHHLILNKRIEGRSTFERMDSWLQSQIDAGKLTLA